MPTFESMHKESFELSTAVKLKMDGRDLRQGKLAISLLNTQLTLSRRMFLWYPTTACTRVRFSGFINIQPIVSLTR